MHTLAAQQLGNAPQLVYNGLSVVQLYDAYLIRCGLEFSAPLLSLDRGLRQVAEHASVDTIEVR